MNNKTVSMLSGDGYIVSAFDGADLGGYNAVSGIYCPDGTHNGKIRYKNNNNWYISWVPRHLLLTNC